MLAGIKNAVCSYTCCACYPSFSHDSKRHFLKWKSAATVALSAFWLPDVKIVDEIGGTEYTVTGSYEGTETLDKKLHRIMEQNAADDELGITEDGE